MPAAACASSALAGNRLTALPAAIGDCERAGADPPVGQPFARLEDALPDGLLALPRLTWLAYAGNPFNADQEARALAATPIAPIAWNELPLGELLGEGASGHIQSARLAPDAGGERPVAVKLFKGGITSDGLPGSEMAACIAADVHAHVIAVEGRIAGHPQGAQGLVMGLIPPRYRSLAGRPAWPAARATCIRPAAPVPGAGARHRARRAGRARAPARARADARRFLRATTSWSTTMRMRCWATSAPRRSCPRTTPRAEALQRIDRRALGVLIDELAQRCDTPAALDSLRP